VISKAIEICGSDFRYFAQVGRGLLAQAGSLARELVGPSRCVIVTDSNIPSTVVERASEGLRAVGFDSVTTVIPPGEESKSLAQVERICGQMIDAGLDRFSVVVGLGGGVVGDLSGFIASVFHRGIPHIQIPTTLLAMVDSSIGGKTGVNLPAGKNLLGAFHHPVLVITDVEVLGSLPQREWRQGFAEIIKHGIIGDAEMFHELQPGTARELVELVSRNIQIKAQVVARDHSDVQGERAILNFGHTVGHAIERAADFRLSHGDCVSLGMVAACDISMKRAGLERREREMIVARLAEFRLPVRLPAQIDRERIMEVIARDKKFERGETRFIVTPRIGQAYLSREVTMADIRAAVEAL
jgi:3-dehydroquinate synthase